MVVATDVPLLPHQLKRVVKRVALGLARTGSISTNSSGDIFLALSTARPHVGADGLEQWQGLPNDKIDLVFTATAQATEEAIINALVAAETMTGINGNTVYALPHDRLRSVLKQYNRITLSGNANGDRPSQAAS